MNDKTRQDNNNNNNNNNKKKKKKKKKKVMMMMMMMMKKKKKKEKYTELRAGIKQLYKNTSVKQITIVFDFLGNYHEELRKGLSSITNTNKELSFLIKRCEKWIICQNANIVKTFYVYV